jgi:TonB family protein
MVAGLFRAPALTTSAPVNQPANAAAASAEVAIPSSTSEPPYPPQALAGGLVVLEATVDTSGKVAAARVISSAPPFDEPALEAARKWRFKPARINGRATTTWVYLVFGFPAPVTGR